MDGQNQSGGVVVGNADSSGADVAAETVATEATGRDTEASGDDAAQGVADTATGAQAVDAQAGTQAGKASKEDENLVEETFKVSGQEVKIKIPKGMTKEQKDLLRKGLTFDREFSSLREREEKIGKIVESLKPGDDKMRLFKVAKAMGWDTDDAVRAYVQARAEEEAMSPEQKELANERALRAELERKLRDQESFRSRVEEEQQTAKFTELFTGAVKGVLSGNEQLAKLPDGEEIVSSVLRTILAAGETPDGETVQKLALVEANRRKSIVKGMSADEIIELIGEDGLKALREADMKRVQSVDSIPKVEAVGQKKRRDKQPDTLSPKEFRERIAQRMKNFA